MAIAAGSSSGSASTGLKGGGSEGLRYRALKYMGGANSAEENEGYFADGENDPSATPLNKFDILISLAYSSLRRCVKIVIRRPQGASG